ncbi:cis-prenyltransferase [Dimargaris xerosporica]|nr:cis-prenyltransferase [Dimargaris xerosporica]
MALFAPLFRFVLGETTQRLKYLLIRILRQGPVPRHVAFIMDGNRRYARRLGMPPQQGHIQGFRKLEQVLEWCMELNIPAVTVYAFSIDNFERPKEEVDTLMNLAKEKLVAFCRESETVRKYGIGVRICGNTDLLDDQVKEKVQMAHDITKGNNRAILNICFPYTSSDEITTALRRTVDNALQSEMDPNDITAKAIENNLFTAGCPDLDLIIRTSGETRFSDFLLWQIAKNCSVHFVKTYWPEFSLWDLGMVMLEYQVNYRGIRNKRQ